MNQSSLQYLGCLLFAVPVALVVVFGVGSAVDPTILGCLLAAVGITLAGTVASVVVRSVRLSWRALYAGGLAAMAVGQGVFAAGWLVRGGAESVFAGGASLVLACSVGGMAVLVVRRPGTIDLTENVDRVVRLTG